MAITFSASEVKRFRRTNRNLRLGQEFHQYFKLEKITNPEDKAWCDKLYETDGVMAIKLIASHTVVNQ